MGVLAGITLTRVEATPYRLRYLMTSTGGGGGTILGNHAGATPDLRTDALTAAENGFQELPLYRALSVPLGWMAGAAQVQARELLLGGPIHVQITPRSDVNVNWAVDANEGAAAGDAASAGFFVYVLASPGARVGATAYLDIKLRRTIDDGGVRAVP